MIGKQYSLSIQMLFCIFTFFVTGCAFTPPKKNLRNFYADKDFTYENLSKNGLLVLGAHCEKNSQPPSESKSLDRLLMDVISYYRNSYKIYSFDNLSTNFPKAEIQNLKTEICCDNIITKNRLARINFPVQYILIYKIKRNAIFQTQNRTSDERCFISTRQIDLQMDIFDTKIKDFVWGGSLSQTMDITNCNTNSDIAQTALKRGDGFGKKTAGFCVGSVFDTLLDSTEDAIIGTYRSPPPTKKVIGRIFVGFVRNFPSIDGKEPPYKTFP